MKTKLLIIALSLLYAFGGRAQPHYQYYNTGISGSGSPFVPNGTQAVGAPDIHWQVSQNLNFGYVTPVVVNPSAFSSPNSPGAPNWNMWISYPFNYVAGSPNNHSGYPGTLHLYYKITFNLPSPSFSSYWLLFADDWIQDIYVNNTSTPVWTSTLSFINHPLNINNAMEFAWCKNWLTGPNTVIIHTVSQPSSNQPPYQGDDITGLKVESWTPGPIPILGSTTVCPNTLNTYTISPITSTAVVNYSWTVPSNWSGGSNTTTLGVTSGTNSGLINVYAWSNNGSNPPRCWATGQLSVNVWPASVTITPSSASVCPGGSVTLTASGASTYTWTLPGGVTSNLNPIVVNPLATTVYTVTGTTVNGCIAKQTVTITTLPQPNIFISPNTPFICAGIANTLTGSGAVSYTWSIVPGITASTSNPWVVNLTPPQTVTLTGTGANGCTNTTTLSLNAGTVVPVSAANVTLCTNAATCTAITATATPLGMWPITYTWQPGNLTGQSPVVCPTVNTVYTVTATSPIGCPGTATMAVIITTNCCSQPTTGLIALSGTLGGTYAGASYFLENNTVLSASAVFSDAEVRIMPGVKITAPAGTGLSLEHAHLYACGINMWKGIVIDDQALISAQDPGTGSNLIEDAEIGIDASAITTNHANIIMNLKDVIFNKNHIGVQLSNSQPAVSSLQINVVRCVFSSRNLPFSTTAPFTTASWPSVSVVNGLRAPSSPNATQGLIAPYPLQNHPSSALKQPYSNQSAKIGIRLSNIGNQNGVFPGTGVNITGAFGPNDFNLFDGLGAGIEVENASLITFNNVFQKMVFNSSLGGGWFGGLGIYHHVNSLMNANLDLRPVGSGAGAGLGNKFWDCWFAVWAEEVYNVNIEYNIFRSTHVTNPNTVFGPGCDALVMNSCRFLYNVKYCEFNNIAYPIFMRPNTGNYNISGTTVNGIYANKVTFSNNYFGPEVSSTTPNSGTEYSDAAILVDGTYASNWTVVGTCDITSNKMDRVYRGIKTVTTDNFPINIAGNLITLTDDNVINPGPQSGIFSSNSLQRLTILQNTVSAQGPNNANVKLIRCANNTGMPSPDVEFNQVSNGFVGFAFEGNQPNTRWLCNKMTVPMKYGFSLEQGGVIGPQGSATQYSGNDFAGTWLAPTNYRTRTINSSPGSSPLYIPFPAPQSTHFSSSSQPYINNSSYITNGVVGLDCINPPPYPAVPNLRLAQAQAIQVDEIGNNKMDWAVEVFPNPSDGKITVTSGTPDEAMLVKITDLAGKIVYEKEIRSAAGTNLDISGLKPSIYLMEIQSQNNQTVRKKIIKTN